MHENNKEVEIR